MIVSFPFTFKFAYPGLPNPFSPAYHPPGYHPPSYQSPQSAPHEDHTALTSSCHSHEPDPMALSLNWSATLNPPSHTTPIMPPRPRNLKRGWEPAFAEASQSTTTLASSSGYLDAPAKRRGIADTEAEHDKHQDLPPIKRRRGLADSLVSTAVNAALIGTAVGYTVYRLWRDRGKEQPKAITAAESTNHESSQDLSHQLPPPPPYQEREWAPVSYHAPPAEATATLHPVTPRRKAVRHGVKRSARKARVPRTQAVFPSPPRVDNVPQPTAGPSSHLQPELDIQPDGEEGEDDQMNWISDKLAQLIEEGKRALNREIVVMSDAKEDEVDDGSGAWEEDEDPSAARTLSHSRSNSLRRGTKRSRNRVFGVSSANNSLTHIPIPIPQQHQDQQQLSTPPTRRSHMKAYSAESATRFIPREDEASWESPELRETMKRARERALANRGFS